MVKIAEAFFGPDEFVEFFAGDDLARALEQCDQDLEGLVLEFQADAVFPQLAGL